MTAALQIAASILAIPLDLIDPSPTNPRKTFTAIDELAADFKIRGVLLPLIVRAVDGGKRYECVAGERRLRAAKMAKLATVPALVRELSDLEVLEIQIVENAKRADIHPVEEAEAYRTLRDTHKLSVAEISAKVGRPVGTVYERLKLCELAPEVRRAALAGELPASHAVLIARIPDKKLQAEALKGLKSYDGGYVPYRDAVDRIHRSYMLQLKNAPFDIADAKLVPAAGACTSCPKRTGNQRELFADVKSPDVCTDLGCYKLKVAAVADVQLKAVEEKGKEVIRGEKADKIFERNYDGSHDLRQGSGYIPLNEGRQYVEGRGYVDVKAAVKKNDIKTVVVADPDTGKMVELVPTRALPKPKSSAGGGANYAEMEKRRKEKEERKRAFARSIIDPLVKRFEKALGKPELVALVLAMLDDRGPYSTSEMFSRRAGKELNYTKEAKAFEELQKSAAKKSEGELRGLLFELIVSTHMTADNLGKQEPEGCLFVAAEALGLNIKGAKVAFEAAQATAAAAAPAAKPKKGKKK